MGKGVNMLLRIVKKDMMKRKMINIILFVFITLSTIFVASSVNNITVVSSAIDYYIDYANVPDLSLAVNSDVEKEEITAFLDKQKSKGELDVYEYQDLLLLPTKSILFDGDGKKETLETDGDNIYIGTLEGNYNKVFDKNGELFTLKDGEIAISVPFAENNNLSINDHIYILDGGIEREFVVAQIMKDATFGNEMSGMGRFIVNEKEHAALTSFTNGLGIYNIMVEDSNALVKQVNNQDFKTIGNVIVSSMHKMMYSMDMVMSALLILIGICLILIALLVLRFTLVFTMEEQYQEIGILKAIGLRDFSIKKIYLMKYLCIVSLGSLLGLIISIPVSEMMVQAISYNMIMEKAEANIMINIVCALFVVFIVLSFCYFCTRKMNRVSAVSAICGGSTGERYHKRRGLSLASRKRLAVPVYLGCNDMLTNVRRFLVLIVTFCISFILITFPLNTLNTMRSEEMASKFGLDVSSKSYLRSIEKKGEEKYVSIDSFKQGMRRVEQELKEKGYNATLKGSMITFTKFNDGKNHVNLLAMQPVDMEENFLLYSEGKPPVLPNEVAISEMIMDQQGWEIGDQVEALYNEKTQKFIITATYSDYMQLGKSARFSNTLENSSQNMLEYWSIMVDIDTDKSQEEMVKAFKKDFPQYDWCTAQELIDKNIGGIQNMLNELMNPMTIMLCVIIMLITLLMEKLFITRERGEIAMLKSIGFKNKTIRYWQMVRMGVVSISALLISIPLSMLTNQFVLKPIFAFMGADVTIQVDPLQAYILYPLFLLVGIIIATYIATISIKHIHIKEINNVE